MDNYCGSSFRVPNGGINTCCWAHDRDFALRIGYFKSNNNFLKCMLRKKAYLKAIVYYTGATLFGWFPYWIKPFFRKIRDRGY